MPPPIWSDSPDEAIISDTRRAALTHAAQELRNRRIENMRPYAGSFASNPQTYAGGELYEPGLPAEQPSRLEEVWP